MTEGQLAEYVERLEQIIAEQGWAVQGVADAMPFAYTVGAALTRSADEEMPDPELIVFGLPYHKAGVTLNDLVRGHRAGTRRLVGGTRYNDVLVGYDVAMVDVEPAMGEGFLVLANRLIAPRLGLERVPALQVVWPDPAGAFPWEPGFDERCRTPVLGAWQGEREGDPR